MNKRYEDALKSRLVPVPETMRFGSGVCAVDETLTVLLQAGHEDEIFVPAVEELFQDYFGVTPKVKAKVDASAGALAEEAYRIVIAAKKMTISAHCFAGIDYALKTLRQLAEPERGVGTLTHYELPTGTIEDAPALAFRGIHLCIFPETPMWVIEKELRLAAYYKFNYAVIESWGVFPFKSHPEFCWRDRSQSRNEFERLKDVAAECGITLVPQFNILGHASVARSGTAKHAVLDFHGELQSLFEPNGWCYCLSNPVTRQVLADLVTELHEFFGSPEYFHIGCDEAAGLATCRACACHEVKDLVLDHITYFHDLLAVRGARSIMWHDMLLDRADKRFDECIVCGGAELAELYRELPKDIVIADWQYGRGQQENKGREFPTSLFFKEAGFDVMLCPWQDAVGTRIVGNMAQEHELFGVLETTWHTAHAQRFMDMFITAADASWSGKRAAERPTWLVIAPHLRQIGYDMDVRDYEKTGCSFDQVPLRSVQGINY